jgi:hypothetical protein
MIVRALNSTGDWTFGASLNNYKSANNAVAQNIQTRLSSFLGNCFFDAGAGIDWFTFLGGSKNELGLRLAIQSVILNTIDVTGLNQLDVNLDHVTRRFSISFQVQTTYSVSQGTFVYDLGGSI